MTPRLRVGTLLAGVIGISLTGIMVSQGQPAQSVKKAEPSGPQNQPVAAAPMIVDGDSHDPFEPVDIPSMTNKSNTIVVGRFQQVMGPRYLEIAHHMNDPNHSVAKMSLNELKAQMFYVIDVDRVIKGDQSLSGTKLKWIDPNWACNIHVDTTNGVSYRDEYNGGIPQLNYGIFFLARDNSQIKFVDKNHCVLPASPVPMSHGSDPLKAVTDELIHVLDTPLAVLSAKGGSAGGESGEGSEGSYSLSAGEVLMRDAVTVLTQLPPDRWKQPLSQLTKGDNPAITKLWAFAGLASKNDWSCYPNVESYILHPSPELHYAANYSFGLLKDKIQTAEGQALSPQIPNSELVAALQSTDVNVRQKVSFLLADKKDPQLIEMLARVAGTDTDEAVRENCRSGLRQLTNIDGEFWEKEPSLALEVACAKSTVQPFDSSLCKGAMFEQNKTTASVSARLGSNLTAPGDYPEWVTNGISWIEDENKRSNPDRFEQFIPAAPAPGWSWEGSEDPQGHKLAWYTFKRRLNPALNSGSDNKESFVIRDTTVALLIELKGGQYPEMSETGVFPQARISDAWQQDDDIIFKRQSKDKVRVLKISRIYGSDGKQRRVSPSGVTQTASVRDYEAK